MEAEVYEFLPSLDVGDLETVFEKMGLAECPEAAKGKKNVLLRLLYKQLVLIAAEPDNGFATLKILHDFLTEAQGIVKEEEKTTVVDPEEELKKFEAMMDKKIKDLKNIAAVAAGSSKKVEVSKFQALKINGTIGTKPGCMSFTDLNFQIKNAQEQGYTDEQVCGAVIKAMSTNNNLRTYFETVADCKLDEMLEILRPYFEQKNSASLFADLCNAAQASEQNCMDFVVGLLGLKLRVADLSLEEGAPMDSKILMGQFRKSLFTGIRNTNIRTDVREFCRGNPEASDQKLIKTVAEAMAIERDRAKKMAGGSEICYLGVENLDPCGPPKTNPGNSNNKKKENLLPAQIKELQASQELLMATVAELQTSMVTTNNLLAAMNTPQQNNFPGVRGDCDIPRNQGNFNESAGTGTRQVRFENENSYRGGNRNNNNRRPVYKCQACLVARVPRCNHCFACNSEDHKIQDCPSKPQQQGGEGNLNK